MCGSLRIPTHSEYIMFHRSTPYARKILHYCGFPISPIARIRYGSHKIQTMLREVTYCKHGDRCEKCCFKFWGNYQIPRYSSNTLQNTFFNLVHPWKKNREIFVACKGRRCVNLFHYVEKKKTEALIESKIQI